MKLVRQSIYFAFALLAIIFTVDAKQCSSCHPIPATKPCPSTPTYQVSKNPPTITKPVIVKVEKKETAPKPVQKPAVPEEKQPTKTEVAPTKPVVKEETQQPAEQKKSGGQVYSVGSLEELNKYIQENDRVIIDIYASWCGPCKKFAPMYEEFAQKHPNIICLKVDGEKVPAVKKKYNVTGYPTFALYKNKQKIDQSSGAPQSLARFEEKVKALL